MSQNSSGIHPAGHRLLILPDEVEKTSAGGIVIPDLVSNKESLAVCEGQVIAVGSCAYQDQQVPWCQPGDRVVFKKFEGFIRPGRDGRSYRVIEDLHVWAVIEEKKDE